MAANLARQLALARSRSSLALLAIPDYGQYYGYPVQRSIATECFILLAVCRIGHLGARLDFQSDARSGVKGPSQDRVRQLRPGC